MKRTQIYLDEEQDYRLAQRARAVRRTKSDLVREAIGDYLTQGVDAQRRVAEFKAAADAAFGIAPYIQHEYEGNRATNQRRAYERDQLWHENELNETA